MQGMRLGRELLLVSALPMAPAFHHLMHDVADTMVKGLRTTGRVPHYSCLSVIVDLLQKLLKSIILVGLHSLQDAEPHIHLSAASQSRSSDDIETT